MGLTGRYFAIQVIAVFGNPEAEDILRIEEEGVEAQIQPVLFL
jgi:hypothetical protein